MKNAVTDQADGLRRLMAAAPRRQVAVVGCDGAGTSAFTRNLAAALVREGKDVLLLDEHGDTHRPPLPAGGALILRHATFDGNAALSAEVVQLADILVVLQPHAASIKASYACIKALHIAHRLPRLRVLVDGVSHAGQAQRILANFSEAGRRYLSLALEPAGWVRAGPLPGRSHGLNVGAVDASCDSPAASDYRQVAKGLLRWAHPAGRLWTPGHAPALLQDGDGPVGSLH